MRTCFALMVSAQLTFYFFGGASGVLAQGGSGDTSSPSEVPAELRDQYADLLRERWGTMWDIVREDFPNAYDEVLRTLAGMSAGRLPEAQKELEGFDFLVLGEIHGLEKDFGSRLYAANDAHLKEILRREAGFYRKLLEVGGHELCNQYIGLGTAMLFDQEAVRDELIGLFDAIWAATADSTPDGRRSTVAADGDWAAMIRWIDELGSVAQTDRYLDLVDRPQLKDPDTCAAHVFVADAIAGAEGASAERVRADYVVRRVSN